MGNERQNTDKAPHTNGEKKSHQLKRRSEAQNKNDNAKWEKRKREQGVETQKECETHENERKEMQSPRCNFQDGKKRWLLLVHRTENEME